MLIKAHLVAENFYQFSHPRLLEHTERGSRSLGVHCKEGASRLHPYGHGLRPRNKGKGPSYESRVKDIKPEAAKELLRYNHRHERSNYGYVSRERRKRPEGGRHVHAQKEACKEGAPVSNRGFLPNDFHIKLFRYYRAYDA